MGRAILTLLCLWSCIIMVMPLTNTQVHVAVEHIKKTFHLSTATKQYSYVAVFSEKECQSLSSSKNKLQILKDEKAVEIDKALRDDKVIYEGSQMVLATFKTKDRADKKGHNIHAEYRLLNPSDKSTVSPVQHLLNKNKNKVACVLFYSLNSPCVGTCTNTKHDDNIIEKLSVFKDFNDKAFVYSMLYEKDITSQTVTKENIWSGLTEINKKMDVYRCFPSQCLNCYQKYQNKLQNKGNCLN